MTTDLFDPVHAVEIVAAKETEPGRRDLETSPLYGFPLGHWDFPRRIDEV